MNRGDTVKNTITIADNVAFPTLRKGKAFKALLFVASQVQRTLEPGSVHSVPISFFSGLLKFKLSNKDTALLLEELEKVKVDWKAYNKDWSGFSHVVSSCRYDRKKETISFCFDSMFIEEYLNQKTPFKNIPIGLIMDFRSNYSLKIYELAYQYYDPKRKEGKTPNYTLNDLRELFNLKPGQYKNSGQFLERVIRTPMKEAIELSDYLIEFHNNNRRGELRRYWFTIKLNPQSKFTFASVENGAIAANPEQDKEEDIQRASRFLAYWGDEFSEFAKRKLSEGDRNMWIEPLLGDEPRLNAFSEEWIIENFFKPKEGKKERYMKENMKN